MVKLKKVWKDAWIKALRSGKYKQGYGKLKEHDWDRDGETKIYTHCCLGVLCEVAGGRFDGELAFPPDRVTENVFLKGRAPGNDGEDEDVYVKLVDMNDSRSKSFKQIANWIEKNL